MSDEFEITHGGAIAVDPDALRAVADALIALTPSFADAADAVRRAHGQLAGLPSASMRVDTVALWGSADRAEALHEECRSAGEGTRLMADAYELVERRVELDALAIQGKAPTDALLDRIAELEASDPRVVEMEAYLLEGWRQGDLQQVATGSSFFLGSSFSQLLLGVSTLIGSTRMGRVPPGAELSGSGGPVSVTPVRTTSPIGPPNTIAEAFRRFPDAPGAQIRVEKYTMPDGKKQFVLYEKGTQPTLDPDEPFDILTSNLDLYLQRDESASYAATIEALKAAGAEPGDEVHAYGHSQAAMNVGYLATQSEFDVSVVVTAGGPTSMSFDEDQLFIGAWHSDDPVSHLAGGGTPAGTGSPDSFIVTRDAAWHDWVGDTHPVEAYIETFELVDGSDDVRMEAWREKARELTDAVSVESTEYVARRE